MHNIDPIKWDIGTEIEFNYLEDREIAREVARRKLLKDPNCYPSELPKTSKNGYNNLNQYTGYNPDVTVSSDKDSSRPYYFPKNHICNDKIQNTVSFQKNTNDKKETFRELISKEMVKKILLFFNFLVKKLKLKNPPKLKLNMSEKQWDKLTGNTGYYDPYTKTITVYIYKRNLSDICRSLSHELIHYWQDLSGRISKINSVDVNYTQTNKDLRKIEKEAYLLGNILFRDFRDSLKVKNIKI